jgi:hypothetical protein
LTLTIIGLLVVTPNSPGRAQAPKPEAPKGKSAEWKVKNAMSAAPASIARNATILDHPAGGGSPSDTDPHAKKPAAGQKWMKEPPGEVSARRAAA